MNRTWIIALFCLLLFRAQAADLGMQAPPFHISEWVKGSPVEISSADQTKTYVLLFWETGCEHCLEILPEMTKLQAKFRAAGLVVVGISTEPAKVIKDFIAHHQDITEFTLGSDSGRKAFQAYMTPFGQGAVPYAFIIGKDGTIIWQRHPMAGLVKAVDELMAGKYDLNAEKRALIAEREAGKYVSELKKDIGKQVSLSGPLRKQIMTDGLVNPWMLNNFACDILDVPVTNGPALDLAVDVAKTAYNVRGEIDSAFADTYAHVLFISGQPEQAIRIQKRAIELCTDAKMLPFLVKTLETYQTNQPAKSK
jgi:peroxiredoxin